MRVSIVRFSPAANVDDATSEGMDLSVTPSLPWMECGSRRHRQRLECNAPRACRSHANAMRRERLPPRLRYGDNARFTPSFEGDVSSLPTRGVMAVAPRAGSLSPRLSRPERREGVSGDAGSTTRARSSSASQALASGGFRQEGSRRGPIPCSGSSGVRHQGDGGPCSVETLECLDSMAGDATGSQPATHVTYCLDLDRGGSPAVLRGKR